MPKKKKVNIFSFLLLLQVLDTASLSLTFLLPSKISIWFYQSSNTVVRKLKFTYIWKVFVMHLSLYMGSTCDSILSTRAKFNCIHKNIKKQKKICCRKTSCFPFFFLTNKLKRSLLLLNFAAHNFKEEWRTSLSSKFSTRILFIFVPILFFNEFYIRYSRLYIYLITVI